MEAIYLSLPELRELMKTSINSSVARTEDAIRCISTVDIFYEVEHIKKDNMAHPILKLMKSRECKLHGAINCGYLVTADLNSYSLEDGLFKVGDDFYSFEFWEDTVLPATDPAHSARLISLRSFDAIWGTGFHVDTADNYSY